MEKNGPDFYDTEEVFGIYTAHRARSESPNETMEHPVLWSLIGDPADLAVLDLGCGDAQVAKKFRAKAARSYVGVEGSWRMVESAQANLEDRFSTVMHSQLEHYVPQAEAFDLIISAVRI